MKEPNGATIYTSFKEAQGTFSMTAERSGRYIYCFSNEMSSYARKVLRQVHSCAPNRLCLSMSRGRETSDNRVSFNVHGVIYMGDDEQIAPVEQAVRDLGTGLQLVKDEQAYLVVRERIHRNSTSSYRLSLCTTGMRSLVCVTGC